MGSRNEKEIINDLGLLTRSPEVLTPTSAATAIDTLDSIIDGNSSAYLNQSALEVLSHLS